MSDDPHAGELAENKRLWEAWTPIHTTGSFYDVERFRRDPTDLRIRPFEGDDLARFVVSDVYGVPNALGAEKPWLDWELPWLQDLGDGR